MSYEDYAEEWNIVHRYTPEGRPAGSWLSTKSVKSSDGRWHSGAVGLVLASAEVIWNAPQADEYVEFSLDAPPMRSFGYRMDKH